MRFSRSTRFVATVTGAFALSLLTGPLLAAPERRASSPRVAPRSLAQPKVGVVSSGRQLRAKSATAYWTPRRMANAKPVRLAKAGRLHAASAPKARAARRVVRIPGTLGAGGAGSSGEEPTPLHATSVPRPYTNYPDRLNGKVFFSKPGGNFVCSGTAVNSENIAAKHKNAAEVMDGWKKSPGHNRNMLDARWTRVGIGMHKLSWGQAFAR